MDIGVFFLTLVMETWGSLYFFDIFLEREKKSGLRKYRFPVYFLMMLAANVAGYWIGMWKIWLFLFGYVLLGRIFFKAGRMQVVFFAVLNYCMIFLTDFVTYCLSIMWMMQETVQPGRNVIWTLSAKIIWLGVFFAFRKIWKKRSNYQELTEMEWLKLSLMPLFTLTVILVIYFCFSGVEGLQVACIFMTVGLSIMNYLVIWLLWEILEKSRKMQESVETYRKTESQLAHYRDMQAIYERQGRKMHDYKNQIRTMQVLLKEGDIQAAAALADRLTESISVEMSAVNTNHPVVNAVLNQKFHAAREQGISMIFKVGDMSGMRLDEEETVILLANLLDNAIHACVKVVQAGQKAVIQIKLVQEDGKMIFSVKNPVAEKVRIMDNIVLDSDEGMHGVGLSNVKAVVDKYGGDFAISCDLEKFQAVVML